MFVKCWDWSELNIMRGKSDLLFVVVCWKFFFFAHAFVGGKEKCNEFVGNLTVNKM